MSEKRKLLQARTNARRLSRLRLGKSHLLESSDVGCAGRAINFVFKVFNDNKEIRHFKMGQEC